MTERKPRGANDPQRRERLVDAALAVMLEQGVSALSHRAVAAHAQVPLGSTTYYFKDLDALLLASIDRLIAHTQTQFADWVGHPPSGLALADALSQRMHERLVHQRAHAVLSYELYVLAMRRPALKPASATWKAVLKTAVAPHLDAAKADLLIAVIDGLMIQGLMAEVPPSAASLREGLVRVLG